MELAKLKTWHTTRSYTNYMHYQVQLLLIEEKCNILGTSVMQVGSWDPHLGATLQLMKENHPLQLLNLAMPGFEPLVFKILSMTQQTKSQSTWGQQK